MTSSIINKILYSLGISYRRAPLYYKFIFPLFCFASRYSPGWNDLGGLEREAAAGRPAGFAAASSAAAADHRRSSSGVFHRASMLEALSFGARPTMRNSPSQELFVVETDENGSKTIGENDQ